MPYTIGSADIRNLAEIAPISDAREGTGFTNSKYLYHGYTHQDWFGQKMIMNYSGYFYSNECGIGSRFLRNGSAHYSVAAKGCRPHPNKRWEVSVSGINYINKFSDGEVWVSGVQNVKTGTRIGTAAENLQYYLSCLSVRVVAAQAAGVQKTVAAQVAAVFCLRA